MYIIIHLNPDGDNYELHESLADANSSFSKVVKAFNLQVNEDPGSVGWDDFITLLCVITDPSNFGFGTHGNVYGMSIIDSLNWED